MKKAIQIGAGNIGRGFIGALLSQAGYEIVFADVNAGMIDNINASRSYTVYVKDTECESIQIKNVRGIDSTKPGIITEIADADIVTTAVGLTILPHVAPTIALAIEKRRTMPNLPPLQIIACENAIRATAQLKEAVYKELSPEGITFANQHVGFADCAVDRIVPPLRCENPIDVVVENYFEWDVERIGFCGTPPEIPGMTLVEHLSAYIERKLFTLNTGHAITAYLGCLRGYETIAEAIADPDIFNIVQQAMRESGEALICTFNFNKQTHTAYIERILQRFRNPYLKDNVTRVGREPLRKLSPNDRLIKPMLTAYGYRLPIKNLIIGIAAALCYNNPSDAQSAELQQMLATDGTLQTLMRVTGIQDESLLERIIRMYDALQNQSAQQQFNFMSLVV